MKKSILLLVTGLMIGIILMSFIDKYGDGKQQTAYIELKEDFYLPNRSVLKKGTMLGVGETLSEGFTRYILYINYKGSVGVESKSYDKENLIKPYWMYIDSAVMNK